MSKINEAIELIEKRLQESGHFRKDENSGLCTVDAVDDGCQCPFCQDRRFLKNIIALLKQKLEPTDKTVGIREFVHDANRDFQADRIKGTHVEDYVRALRELKELCDEIDRLNARNKVKQELLEVTENMLNIKIAENKQQAERIEELEGTLSKDNTPEIDHKYINNIAKEVRAEFEQPEPSEFTKEKLFFNPEQPTCPICHTTLYLEDGMEWSDNPIHNCCCDCQSNIIDRLTERIQELEKYIASRKDFVDPSKP